jgi:hypothetical protein
MKKMFIIWILIMVLLTSCGEQPQLSVETEPVPTEVSTESPGEQDQGEEKPSPAERLLVNQDVPPPGMRQDRTALVAAAGNCSACHSGLVDGDGNDVSFDSLWRNSMHAFAAIDPYWQASVSVEVAENPDLGRVIEDKCASCHMPLAWFDVHANRESASILGEGFANRENPLHDLAMDGVSCTACHQIMADNLGSTESYSGGFMIDSENTVYGEREIYGPLPVSEQGSNIMAQASGFLAVQSEHIADSAMCATCHTLYTPYLNAAGEVAGEFPEQMAYFEWQNSSYAQERSCQDCHMPAVGDDVLISSVMGDPHEYLRLHTFRGGNAFMLGLIGAGMSPENRADGNRMVVLEATGTVLQTQTAAVQVLETSIEDTQLAFDVSVTSLTGHKFPTGFPSRRAWLYVTVTDAAGDVVFESGAVNKNGLIEGNDNDLDPARFEPHYTLITGQDQVQIYETILGTTENKVTTTLLYGAEYLKDNRLLPNGFKQANVIPETDTYGLAADDPDFVGGGDRIRYLVDFVGTQGPFNITVELKYQSVGYRWAENLRQFGTKETEFFLRLYDVYDNSAETVASVELKVGE